MNNCCNTKSFFFLCAFFLLCFCKTSQAQTMSQPMFMHMYGKMVQVEKYADVNGSPFFPEEWQNASLITSNGLVINNIPVKLDLLTHEIHYLDSAGSEMVSTQIIKSVIFLNTDNDTSAIFINKYALNMDGAGVTDNWMQLLAKGKATLLKQYFLTIFETKDYGSATLVKTLRKETGYFIYTNNTLTRVKNNQDIADALKDPALDTKVSQGKKNAKAEADLKALVDYYNKL